MKATMLAREKVLEWLGEREVERTSVKHEFIAAFQHWAKLHEHDRPMR
jgi:hypothetical protein